MRNDDAGSVARGTSEGPPTPGGDAADPARVALSADDTDAAAGVPVWFLDVDGVINIDTDASLEGTNVVELVVRGWPVTIRYRPAVVSRINALQRSGMVEVVWLTTWHQDAVDVLSPAIGLDPFSVADERSDGPSLAAHPENALGLTWWKEAAARVHLMQRRSSAFVWTDDELAVGRTEVHSWAPGRKLLLAPEPHLGLTVADLSAIEAFVRPSGPSAL
ncbi:HAD domain-containing protein [Cellulomonas dongxiuzhuiae]|uniref:HAD domain-containing protein n=1 Tax=Cellulomonas dongxiuzhuiae TaxID=2819979 RepID=UPI001AB00AFA|nr:HAD domain-containing protein [Cellulomonas dongxiuzhuiae]MBO3089486.1 hypothetical protein [Cellulomonas dongxiuzhuiae]